MGIGRKSAFVGSAKLNAGGLSRSRYHRLRGKLKYTTTWHMDETNVRIAGRWYLFRAVDSHGDTADFYLSETRDREAAKTFLQKALSKPDNRTPRVLCMDWCRIYPAAIRDLRAEERLPQRCRRRTKRYANNRIELIVGRNIVVAYIKRQWRHECDSRATSCQREFQL
jgi:transposase-like protein